jgi:hypothetical protein
MSLELPRPVATYMAAERAKDPELLISAFADDARVHDEGNDYRGTDGIKAWWQEAQLKYQYAVEPLDASISDDTVNVRARLTGNFPGSPAEVTFSFVTQSDRITSLSIG